MLQGGARADELQRMSIVAHETLRRLRAQEIPVDQWDMIIVHCLHESLDSETARTCELQRGTETPTTVQMLEFLDRQATARPCASENRRQRNDSQGRSDQSNSREASRFNRFNNERDGERKRNGEQQRERSGNSGQRTATANRASGATSKQAASNRKEESGATRLHTCELCNGEHQLYKCNRFLELNFRSRKDYEQSHHLCENCLKRGHAQDSCWQGPRCPGGVRHNSVLCPTFDVNKPAAAMSAPKDAPAAKRKAKSD